MKDKVLIFICFTITLLFFMRKPLYFLLIFMIFSHERFLFISLVFSYLKAKKSGFYESFNVSPLKTTRISTYEIWLKINEIYAYKRLYVMIIAKKKINFKAVLIASIFIFFGFPLKVYKIARFLIYQNVSLHESLIRFYFWIYGSVENKKIEVYGKETYQNLLEKKDIILKIYNLNPQKSPVNTTITYMHLIEAHKRYMFNNEKFSSGMSLFKMGRLITEEKREIKRLHWTNEDFRTIKGEKLKNIVHVTSNVPKKLTDSQCKSIAIQGLIKPKSPNPGSIITGGAYSFEPTDPDPISVESKKLDYVLFAAFGKDLNSQNINEFVERNIEIRAILGPSALDTDIHEFSACVHDLVLKNDLNKNFEELLAEIKEIVKK